VLCCLPAHLLRTVRQHRQMPLSARRLRSLRAPVSSARLSARRPCPLRAPFQLGAPVSSAAAPCQRCEPASPRQGGQGTRRWGLVHARHCFTPTTRGSLGMLGSAQDFWSTDLLVHARQWFASGQTVGVTSPGRSAAAPRTPQCWFMPATASRPPLLHARYSWFTPSSGRWA
jgi:hypothetical protein